MGPSAASTAEDGPLCRPEPLIVTTNVHDDLIPRLQDGTRLIGFKAIPFNSSTFQDDDLEEMLLLVFPTVPSESDTTATPTITSEHKKKLQESLLKLKSEVTMVVSDEIKSMIVRKAQQLKMSIDGEEGHRLVTNWLEILDNWRSDPQDDNFLRVIDCVQIQFDGVTWVARLERKIMDKLGLKYIPASVKRYDELRRRKSIESGKKIGPPYRGCVWQILQYHRSICKKVIQKSQKQRNLRTRRTAEEIKVTRRQLEKKKSRTPQDKLGLKCIPASVKRYDELRCRKSIESGKKIGPPYRGCVWQILQYHRSICKKVIQKSQKQRNLRTRRTAEEIKVTRRQLEKKKSRTPQEQRREWLRMNPLGSASNPLPLGESDSEEEKVSSMFAMIDYY
ncbi:hypothetical protein ACA910_007558 [Epithemia clementina (nom. ined.)]